MVAVQVMGNDAAIGFAASQGNFELNVFMPVCAYNFLQSVRLLAEAIVSFDKNCASGIVADKDKMYHNLHNSLMLVTALNPYIGYENAAKVAKTALAEGKTIRQTVIDMGFVDGEKLTEEELAVYKRGRNAKVNSVPQHADVAQYHAATGLETLFGWLYLLGRTQRLRELFAVITEVL